MLVDGVMTVNKLVDLAKRSIKAFLIFKFNFKKMYDSVS